MGSVDVVVNGEQTDIDAEENGEHGEHGEHV